MQVQRDVCEFREIRESGGPPSYRFAINVPLPRLYPNAMVEENLLKC
jgi:hypothetical protein